MPYSANYPATVLEVLDDGKRYRPGVLSAMRRFRRSHPFRRHHPLQKFRDLAAQLAPIYDIPVPEVRVGRMTGGSSGASSCQSLPGRAAVITMRGRMSVVTFLHEFAHALGRDERGACRWSLNLFRRIFPVSFARLRHVGHTVVRGSQ